MSRQDNRYRKNDSDRMPLWFDFFVNYIFKSLVGFIIFMMIYRPRYDLNSEFELIYNISYVVFYSSIATVSASVFIGILYKYISNRLKRSRRSRSTAIVKFFTKMDGALYEMLGTIFRAVLLSVGLSVFVGSMTDNFIDFMIIFVAIKFGSNLFAWIITKFMYKKVFFILTITMIYTALIAIVIIQIVGGMV